MSRSVYLRIAGLLRGRDIGCGGHRHSVVSQILYESFLESEMLIQFKAYGMMARSALMSHADVDYDKASMSAQGMYRDMVAAVDYIGRGRTSTDLLAEERQEFVNKYLEMRKRSLRDAKAPVPDEGDKLEIKKV